MSDLPAVLGGKPAFPSRIGIVKPVLPPNDSLDAAVADILSTGMATKGKYLAAFEDELAKHLGVRHAVAVSSCTSGLMLVYRGLGLTGDAVVPSFTFMATVSALCWAGARPVFADVDGESTNLDPASAERAFTKTTSALVAVHNFGSPADLRALNALAARKGVPLIVDAAHGFGTLYDGKPVGGQAAAHVFSLSPTKLLIAGEGGVVATNDDKLAERVRIGREYGNDGKYDSLFAGLNARMPEFNAAMGKASLKQLEQAAKHRNNIVSVYRERLKAVPGLGFQSVLPSCRSSYKDLSITIDRKAFGLDRDAVAEALGAENVDTRKYYDPPVHKHAAYRQYAPAEGSLPVTDRLAATSLSLPVWSDMPEDLAARIAGAVERIHRHASKIAGEAGRAKVYATR